MDDTDKEREKEEEGLEAGLSSGFTWAIVFVILGLLIGLFSIFDFGIAGLGPISLFVFSSALLGFCLGFIYGTFPKKLKPLALLIVILVLVLIFYWLSHLTRGPFFIFLSPIKNVFSESLIKMKSVGKTWQACFEAKPPCPFIIDWESPEVKNKEEEINIVVNFSEKKIINDEINLFVSLSVTNPEIAELKIKPRCYLGKNKIRELTVTNLGTYSYGDEFVFGISRNGEEFHTSFRCSGEIPEASDKPLYSEEVIVVLERDVSVKTTWPIYIGDEPKVGLVKSSMEFNAPYSIAIVSNDDMPFNEGKEYSLSIVMKKQSDKSKLKYLEYMKLSFLDNLAIDCRGFNGLEIRNYNYEELKKNFDYVEEFDKFSWPCRLYVINAPKRAIVSPLTIETRYNVASEFSTKIIKSPS